MIVKEVNAPAALKLSYYNFTIPKEDGGAILYNAASGVVIDIRSPDEMKRLQSFMASETILYDQSDEMLRVFYEKGVLVPQTKNEYTCARYCYERDVVRNNTLRLTLITTRQCNLRCVYCYEEHENKVMPPELYESLLKHMDQGLENRRYSGVSIGLFGGEPFVEYDAVIRFLERAKAVCVKHNAPFSAGATTNGALIYPDRFERLCNAGCQTYQISVDGFAETHDKYRPDAAGKGSWRQIMDNLDSMHRTGFTFKVIIRTNFNDEIVARASEFYRFIRQRFDRRFTVYYEGIKHLGGSNDEHIEVLDNRAVHQNAVDIAATLKEIGLGNDVVNAFTMPYARVCYASKPNDYLIDWDGSILKCTLALDDDLNKIGFVGENGEFNVDTEKHANWVSCKADLSEECKKCRVLPLCFGGRCVNGRVHGEPFTCDAAAQEMELAHLVRYF